MASTQKRTFSLPLSQAKYIDKLVKKGGYASGSEVVRAGLRALKERDEAMERWLREEVLPVCEDIEAGREELLTPEQVHDALLAHHAMRTRKSA